MAADNRTLARFELVGIPPAPRGAPRIDVVFDIDTNGIVSVSARDLATQQEQRIRVHSASGLTEDEIQEMIRSAESFREEDKKKSIKAQLRNQVDALLYDSEKEFRSHGEKLGESDQERIQSAIDRLRAEVADGDEAGVKDGMRELSQAKIPLDEVVFSGEDTEEIPEGQNGIPPEEEGEESTPDWQG